MSEFRVATRYAKSLIELASEQKVLDKVYEDMKLFSKTGQENRELAVLLKNPIVKGDKKSSILSAIFEGKVEKLTLAFMNLVAKKGRDSLLMDIAAQFINQYNELKGLVNAELTTTFTLNDELRAEFTKIIENISGKKPLLTEKVDDSLIGGFLLKVGDRQLDESVSSKLSQLKQQLINRY